MQVLLGYKIAQRDEILVKINEAKRMAHLV